MLYVKVMGLSGLLEKVLPAYVDKRVTVQAVVAAGHTRAGVDCSAWLHSGMYGAAIAIYEDLRPTAIAQVEAGNFTLLSISILDSRSLSAPAIVIARAIFCRREGGTEEGSRRGGLKRGAKGSGRGRTRED